MEVRRLSRDSLWIEMPLSTQTLRLIWRAMAACGLQNGKINNFEEHHSSPLFEAKTRLVEGRAAPGLFSDNVRVQAQLTPDEGGTRVDFDAVHLRDEIDFGASRRFQKRLMPRIEQFLREAPLDWKEDAVTTVVAPLASPTDFALRPASSEPSIESLIPLRDSRTSFQEKAVRLSRGAAVMLTAFLDFRWHTLTLIFFALAVWTLWNGRQRKKMDWVSLLLFLALGLWPLVRRWF